MGEKFLQHEDLTKSILQACFEVSNELGSGFVESVYEKALLVALHDLGLDARAQVPLKVNFRNRIVGDFFADIMVGEQVLIELKAAKIIAPVHVAQILNYLKASQLKVGLLVNFGTPRLEYRRFNNYSEEI
jgi:GxxExxY protein